MSALRKELGYDEILGEVRELKALVKQFTQNSGPRFYTIDQVAEAWGVSTKTIRRRMDEGELPFVRKGGRKLVKREDV